MLLLLKTTVTLLLLVFGLQIALSATLISNKHSSSKGQNNELDGFEKEGYLDKHFKPNVGLYVKNYAGKVITVVGENSNNRDQEQLVLSVPVLKVDDHIWEGKSITLECWSKEYPVYWEYRGLGAPKVRVTTERRAPDYYNVSTYTYGAVVTFSSTNYRQTGEYSCRPVDWSVSSGGQSLFLFVAGKKLFVVNDEEQANANRSVKVTADDDNIWVTLPCATSDKEAVVELFSMDGDNGFKQVKLGESLEYDPLEGFRLKWKGLGAYKNPWGRYLCIAKNEKIADEKLYLKLNSPNIGNRFFLLGGASSSNAAVPKVSIAYNPTSRQIECCSATAASTSSRARRGKRQISLPRMRLLPCVSISDCYFSSAQMASGTSLCSRQGNGECVSDSFIKRVNESCVAYELPDIHEAGVLDCSVDGEDAKVKDGLEAQMHFSYEPALGFVTSFDPEGAKTSEILGIGREQQGGQSESTATYFCRPNSFFFSNGIKWAVERRVGGKGLEFIREADARPTLKVDESKVSKVVCFGPIWDSPTDWRNVSMNVPS